MRISAVDSVEDVMREDPAIIRAFLDFKFACVGCPIGSFHSVAYACQEHGVDVGTFLSALQQAAAHADA
jgi:hybrid cluster-associated redox disulfide protein